MLLFCDWLKVGLLAGGSPSILGDGLFLPNIDPDPDPGPGVDVWPVIIVLI